MSEDEKLELVIQLKEFILNTNIFDLGSPVGFVDTESKNNLDLKIKVLQKMAQGKELTEEESTNRNVFELLPKGKIGTEVQIN